ncbi:MAG: DUF2225 domain-containing protein [Syntrophomonadaceae bacterium]|nr:DUF2225 domain-containing protein [Syntrophomonadaceae bacterium]
MSEKADDLNLLSGLEEFGFTDLDSISLYGDPESKRSEAVKPKEKTEEDYLFDRTVECPVCSSKVRVRAVRKSALRVVSRDSDSMVTYEGINPLFYDIFLCNTCGYAGTEKQFTQRLLKTQIDLIKQNISSRWRPKEYPRIYDADIAIERFKLALLNCVVRKAKNSDIALLCLKLGWVYRVKGDRENEVKYLTQAQVGFKEALAKESPPIAGMDGDSVEYIIGELARRIGDYKDALFWFGRVLGNTQARQSLKDKARDQKYLIADTLKKMRQAQTDKTAEEPAERAKPAAQEGKKGLGKLLFGGIGNLVRGY